VLEAFKNILDGFKTHEASNYLGLVFSGKISNAPFADFLMLWWYSNSTNAILTEKQ